MPKAQTCFASSQFSAAWPLGDSGHSPPVFHQKWPSDTLSLTAVSQESLQFLCQGFNFPVKGITKVVFLRYFASPTSPPARGRSHPTVTAGIQHTPLCLAFPMMQTRFACLYFGAVLKAFSPGQLRLWRRSTSHTKLSLVATPSSFPLQPGWCWTPVHTRARGGFHNGLPMPRNWLKQVSYPSTHGTSTTVVLIPSSPCLLQPTDIFTQPIKSLQWMLNPLLFGFSTSQTMLLWVENYLLPPLLPSPVGFLSICFFCWPSCNPGLISSLSSLLLHLSAKVLHLI